MTTGSALDKNDNDRQGQVSDETYSAPDSLKQLTLVIEEALLGNSQASNATALDKKETLASSLWTGKSSKLFSSLNEASTADQAAEHVALALKDLLFEAHKKHYENKSTVNPALPSKQSILPIIKAENLGDSAPHLRAFSNGLEQAIIAGQNYGRQNQVYDERNKSLPLKTGTQIATQVALDKVVTLDSNSMTFSRLGDSYPLSGTYFLRTQGSTNDVSSSVKLGLDDSLSIGAKTQSLKQWLIEGIHKEAAQIKDSNGKLVDGQNTYFLDGRVVFNPTKPVPGELVAREYLPPYGGVYGAVQRDYYSAKVPGSNKPKDMARIVDIFNTRKETRFYEDLNANRDSSALTIVSMKDPKFNEAQARYEFSPGRGPEGLSSRVIYKGPRIDSIKEVQAFSDRLDGLSEVRIYEAGNRDSIVQDEIYRNRPDGLISQRTRKGSDGKLISEKSYESQSAVSIRQMIPKVEDLLSENNRKIMDKLGYPAGSNGENHVGHARFMQENIASAMESMADWAAKANFTPEHARRELEAQIYERIGGGGNLRSDNAWHEWMNSVKYARQRTASGDPRSMAELLRDHFRSITTGKSLEDKMARIELAESFYQSMLKTQAVRTSK